MTGRADRRPTAPHVPAAALPYCDLMLPAHPVRDLADVLDAMYRTWLDNPDSVDPTWRAFFQGFTLGSGGTPLTAASTILRRGA